MQYGVFRKIDSSFVITKYGNFTLIKVVVLKPILYPKELSTTSCTYMYFASALDNAVEPLFLHIQLATNKVTPCIGDFPFKFISNTTS